MNETLGRLAEAINRHDPEAMAKLFAGDYRSEQPAHPNRGFGGREQVETNWRGMFAGVPDLAAEVLSSDAVGDRVWSEWDWKGNHGDGSTFHMRGVIVLGLTDGPLISWAHLYMEPVEQDGLDIEASIQELVEPKG